MYVRNTSFYLTVYRNVVVIGNEMYDIVLLGVGIIPFVMVHDTAP